MSRTRSGCASTPAKRRASQPVDEIDLLHRIDAKVAGQPELVNAAADVAVAVFEQVDKFLASAPARSAARFPDRPERRKRAIAERSV